MIIKGKHIRQLCRIVDNQKQSDNLKTILTKEEFLESINNCDKLVCFVNTNWSGTSRTSLSIFKELCANRPDIDTLIIENDGESFIYQWLKDQEETFEKTNTELKKRPYSWIHANGEVFGVQKENFVWFKSTLNGQSVADLSRIEYWK